MKLREAVSLIFVLGVVEFPEMVNSVCLVRNTVDPTMYWYQCSMSTNYLADVEAAPVDVSRIMFSNTKMQVIRNRSFARLSSGLEILQIHFSEIEGIEDDAFQELGKLRSLEIIGSGLQIIKGAWFKGLSSLKTVSFRNNEIKQIEGSFFSILPPLENLDISENELSCIPWDSLATFKTKSLRFQHNVFTWKCMASLADWLTERGFPYNDFKRDSWDASMELVLECQDLLRKSDMQLNEQNLKECAEKKATELLPPQTDYTVDQVCKFLKNRPSLFLNCSK